jgi:hypothetical protein
LQAPLFLPSGFYAAGRTPDIPQQWQPCGRKFCRKNSTVEQENFSKRPEVVLRRNMDVKKKRRNIK